MNLSKKINVNFSSLVGLKAELLRKQTEVKAAKMKVDNAYVAPTLKRKLKKSEEEKLKADLIDVQDISAHKKSKLMLEAKARLYERLKKSKNNTENFLVDFANKSDESENEHPVEIDYNDEALDPDDNWVEYEDCFGRTRKCLRKDLSIMKEKDELVKRQIIKNKKDNHDDKGTNDFNSPILEKEPEIEIMRRKWEEQTQKLAEKVNIHYQDILFDEARSHGVGYYAFSQDEEERAKQQESLTKLRKETEEKQKEMKELKELRDKIEQNRLKAARIRQRIRAGLPAEPTEEELVQENVQCADSDNTSDLNKKEDTANETNDKDSEKEETNINQKDDANKDSVTREDKIKAFEEMLDKTSRWRQMSQEEWIHVRRQDRKEEFAPMYNNVRSAELLYNIQSDNADSNGMDTGNDSSTWSYQLSCKSMNDKKQLDQDNSTNNNLTKLDNDNDFVGDSEMIGPFPSSELYSVSKKHASQEKHSKTDSMSDTDNTNNSNNLMSGVTSHKKMNEESIAAGLRYLRTKFEQKRNY